MMNAAKVIERTTLRHFPWDLFIEMSSKIVGDGFSEALKIRHFLHFLGGHAPRPL